MRKPKVVIVSFLTALFFLIVACTCYKKCSNRNISPGCPADTLFIYCIDVRQGDATLIISPDKKTILIDAGRKNMGFTEVFPFLDSLHITSLDYIVATHYDEDHIGGIDEVINTIGLDSIKECVFDRGWGGAPRSMRNI